METTSKLATLVAALEIALPYVQKVADTLPTTNSRMGRKMQACKDARMIREILEANA